MAVLRTAGGWVLLCLLAAGCTESSLPAPRGVAEPVPAAAAAAPASEPEGVALPAPAVVVAPQVPPAPVTPEPTAPEPTAPQPTAPEPTVPQPTSPQPTALEPSVKVEGANLRLTGLQNPGFPDRSPDGRAALIQTNAGLYRLLLPAGVGSAGTELKAVPYTDSAELLDWAGPDTALLTRWENRTAMLMELSLSTGAWHPLAALPGRIQLCQNGADWLWVSVSAIREGGAGYREIGPLYRSRPPGTAPAPAPATAPGATQDTRAPASVVAPAPAPATAPGATQDTRDPASVVAPAPAPGAAPDALPLPLTGALLLERGALLGRLADGSCLADSLDGRLLLIRPGKEPETLVRGGALPLVTRDGQGLTWLEEEGECPECIELGPGVPFRRLVWWRLNGSALIADLERPQAMEFLLTPDGQRLIVGHRDPTGSGGAIGSLGPEGFVPNAFPVPAPGSLAQSPAPGSPTQAPPAQPPASGNGLAQGPLMPAGWLGSTLLLRRWADGWRYKSPVFRAEDGTQVAELLHGDGYGGLLLLREGRVEYRTSEGRLCTVSDPGPLLQGPPGGYGVHRPPRASYLSLRQGDDLLLLRCEPADRPSGLR